MKFVYINFEKHDPAKGKLIKTSLPLPKLAMYLASLIMYTHDHNLNRIIDRLPNTYLISEKQKRLHEFARYIFNNNANSKNVVITKDNPKFDSGIRVSRSFFENKHIYVINLNRILQTHSGTNVKKYHHIAKRLIANKSPKLVIKGKSLKREKPYRRLFA